VIAKDHYSSGGLSTIKGACPGSRERAMKKRNATSSLSRHSSSCDSGTGGKRGEGGESEDVKGKKDAVGRALKEEA